MASEVTQNAKTGRIRPKKRDKAGIDREVSPQLKIFSNVGTKPVSKGSTRFSNDKAPGSKTIFLDLNVGDQVDVVQLRHKTAHDVKLSFCGLLLHLNKVTL